MCASSSPEHSNLSFRPQLGWVVDRGPPTVLALTTWLFPSVQCWGTWPAYSPLPSRVGDRARDKEGDTRYLGNRIYFVNSGHQERAPGPETLMGEGHFVPGALIIQPGQKQGVCLLEAGDWDMDPKLKPTDTPHQKAAQIPASCPLGAR